MNTTVTKSPGYVIGEISPEQFIADHSFMYVIKGVMRCYDGNKTYTFKSGNYGLARKNRLGRYKKEKVDGELEKVFIFFDEGFLRMFQEKHKIKPTVYNPADTLVKINTTELIPNFIRSLMPYYRGGGKIDIEFADIKREELLVILLKNQPELAGIFFNYGIPEKINLEEFMNCNYTFNVSIGRFAYLTGRSLSAFKRDFKTIFNETPNRWLVQKRLQEAHFLLDKKNKKPSEIYLDLGFEDLSHFSFAFKKLFGMTPTELTEQRNKQRAY
ncbi:MAG: AraC family transcriptional regulator [Puia sp.]|nr:AraC family transcriptional regulator [Puia sp.]